MTEWLHLIRHTSSVIVPRSARLGGVPLPTSFWLMRRTVLIELLTVPGLDRWALQVDVHPSAGWCCCGIPTTTGLAPHALDAIVIREDAGCLPQFRDRRLFTLSGSVEAARRVMDGRTSVARMPVADGCEVCLQAVHIVRTDLEAIGIDIRVEKVADLMAAIEHGGPFDLVLTTSEILYPDPASFLPQLPGDVPSGWMPQRVTSAVLRINDVQKSHRQGDAAVLADDIVREEPLVIPFGIPQTTQFVGPGVGCRVLTSVAYGLDLAAICRAPTHS